MAVNMVRDYIVTGSSNREKKGYFGNLDDSRNPFGVRSSASSESVRGISENVPISRSAVSASRAGTQTPASQGINTYKRNSGTSQSAVNDISRGASLYLSAGPKRLLTASLLSGNSTTGALSALTRTIQTTMAQGIQSLNQAQSGSSFMEPLYGSSTTSFLSSLAGGVSGGSGFLSSGSSIFGAVTGSTSSLSEAAGLYLKSGMGKLEQASVLFSF